MEYIEVHQSLRDVAGRRLVVRNGHLPERQILTGVRALGQNEGHLHTHPLQGAKLPKAGKRKPGFMTPAQLEGVLNAIDPHVEMKKPGGHIRDGEVLWLKDVIFFSVETGMRRVLMLVFEHHPNGPLADLGRLPV